MAPADKAKHSVWVDFDSPVVDELTVLIPAPVASYCYLFEALLWIAFQRFPLFVESEDGADRRTDNTDLEGIEPRVEVEPVSDDECQSAGLPLNPEYAVYMAGDYYSRPEDIERIQLLHRDEKERAQLASDLIASREYYKRRDAWGRQFDQFLDLHKSQLFIALREGKILGVGKVLPPGADHTFPEDVPEEEWYAWCDVGWSPIPQTGWLYNGIDWEQSQAFGVDRGHALILVSTMELMAAFPAESQPTDQVVRIGGSYRLTEQIAQPRNTRRGRPAFEWDEFHLELARRLSLEALPSKQEALIADMQAWCLEKWGRSVGRSTLLGKIGPYHRLFARKSENPKE